MYLLVYQLVYHSFFCIWSATAIVVKGFTYLECGKRTYGNLDREILKAFLLIGYCRKISKFQTTFNAFSKN